MWETSKKLRTVCCHWCSGASERELGFKLQMLGKPQVLRLQIVSNDSQIFFQFHPKIPQLVFLNKNWIFLCRNKEGAIIRWSQVGRWMTGWGQDVAQGITSGAFWGQLTVDVAVGSTGWNSYGERPKQTVRDSPRWQARPATPLPEKGQGQGRDPQALDSFTYLKIFHDFWIISKSICGKCHEYFQVFLQKAHFLRGQRTHVRGKSWRVFSWVGWSHPHSFPILLLGTSPDSSFLVPFLPQVGPWTAPKVTSQEVNALPRQALHHPWTKPVALVSCMKGLGGSFCTWGKKILPQTDSKKAKVCLKEIFAAKRPWLN